MFSAFKRNAAGALLLMTLAASSAAQTVSPVQSTATPEKIPTAGPVYVGGTDARSLSFMTTVLPEIQSLINVNLRELAPVSVSSAMKVDPSKLILKSMSDVRVYFVGEGAGYHNSVGLNLLTVGGATPATAIGPNPELLFPDASSTVSTYNPAAVAKRTAADPLLPGDFVELGLTPIGTILDFFLISNGANGWTTNLSIDAARNQDGLNHVVSFVMKDSPMLILAFEDMYGGGDKDYNDVILAIDIGKANVAQLIGGPEPAFWAVLLGMLGVALVWVRRGTSV